MADEREQTGYGDSMAKRVAPEAAGTGIGGHGGTGGQEERQATPGRVSAGSTGGDGLVGGSAIGDEGLGDTEGGTTGGFGGTGGGGTSGGIMDATARSLGGGGGVSPE